MAEAQKRRIVFMGTPEFAAIILEKIIARQKYEIAGVYCQPDKKSGRGLKTSFQAVKKLALENNIPVFQPASLKSPEAAHDLRALAPDFIIVAAYGLILPQNILDMAAIAPINVHASLLPAYRGAAPIQRAMMENPAQDAVSGISIMKMASALDAGPVYAQETVPINRDNFKNYEARLATIGADLLLETLDRIDRNRINPVDQDETGATYAHKLEKSDGHINWAHNADVVDALVRAVTPWPGARTIFQLSGNSAQIPVTILSGAIGELSSPTEPGTIIRQKRGLAVACKDRWYNIDLLRPEGRREMTSAAFANGQCEIKSGICGFARPCE